MTSLSHAGELRGATLQHHVGAVVELVEHREARRGRERVPRQRARLVHGPERCEHVHDVGSPAERADGKTAADHLAEAA